MKQSSVLQREKVLQNSDEDLRHSHIYYRLGETTNLMMRS